MTASSVGRAILLVCGLVLAGLQFRLGAWLLSSAWAMPAATGSGGIGAVSAGCAGALVEFGSVIPTIFLVAIARRRVGRRGKQLALLLAICVTVGWAGAFILWPSIRASALALGLQYLSVGAITLLTVGLLARAPRADA